MAIHGGNGFAISHLYFFDDLTYHLRRATRAANWPPERVSAVLAGVWRHLHQALDCLDMGRQDYVLVHWEHAQRQLVWHLAARPEPYDLVVSQGCQGEYALESLTAEFRARTGRALADHCANVRIAHLLRDKEDPFYADFELGVSRGAPVARRAADIVAGVPMPAGRPLRLAVFDDCIQTGKGTAAVLDALLAALPVGQPVEVSTIAFIGCESTQEQFRELGYAPVQGVLLRGETYPESWDNDVYFLKDLFLPNAIRFTDGTSIAYVDDEAWIGRIFAGDPARAVKAFRALADLLAAEDLYDGLVAL